MEEKTHAPTRHKIDKEREKGNVPKSAELSQCAQLLALMIWLSFEGAHLMQSLDDLLALLMRSLRVPFDTAMTDLAAASIVLAVNCIGRFAILLGVLTIAGHVAQVGFLFAVELARPKFDHLNPVTNVKNLLSVKSIVKILKAIVKISILTTGLYIIVLRSSSTLRNLLRANAIYGFSYVVLVIKQLLLLMVGMSVIISVAEYFFEKFQHLKKLRMSKREVDRESNDLEGNKKVKETRRKIGLELLNDDLGTTVGKSSLVVRNPTHLAVCLLYEDGRTPLPVVLAKGRGERARYIVRLAFERGIPVVEQVQLARKLIAHVKVGAYIHEELFEPVAMVLHMAAEQKQAMGENG